LLSIVGIVGLYEIVSTIMDFQFASTIVHYLEGPAISRQCAEVFAITNTVPTLVEEEYNAKAILDMFVQRFAMAMAVFVSLAITSMFDTFASMRWLSVFTILVLLLWMLAARYAGQRFRVMMMPAEAGASAKE
jgi:hypothetical protein